MFRRETADGNAQRMHVVSPTAAQGLPVSVTTLIQALAAPPLNAGQFGQSSPIQGLDHRRSHGSRTAPVVRTFMGRAPAIYLQLAGRTAYDERRPTYPSRTPLSLGQHMSIDWSATVESAHAGGKSLLGDILQLSDESLEGFDIGLLNLLCANGLRGAERLELNRYVVWLDEAARKVERATEENNGNFLDSPTSFMSSYARFCSVCLVTVLQRKCGVCYNPKWKLVKPDQPTPAGFGSDAHDMFIHAIIDGVGGTCASLPVLYTAVGRRLGYPLRIVKAAHHLFVRWDDADGRRWLHPDRFNIEATGPGTHFLPDEHYREWPHKIPKEDIDEGVFLRSLSRHEELAEFMVTRGFCLQSNRLLVEAVGGAEGSR